jgi:hypothetical protein
MDTNRNEHLTLRRKTSINADYMAIGQNNVWVEAVVTCLKAFLE